MGKNMSLGPFQVIDKKEIPYFEGVKEFKLNEAVESPYFVFMKDTVLEVLKTKFSLKKYLKGLLSLNFNLENGYINTFEKEIFPGEYAFANATQDDIMKKVIGSDILNRPKQKAYVILPKFTNKYDVILGEVSDDGKEVIRSYKCRITENPDIIKGINLDLNCQKVSARFVEKLVDKSKDEIINLNRILNEQNRKKV